MFEPRPEIRTATRLRAISSPGEVKVSGIADAGPAGLIGPNRAEPHDRAAHTAQHCGDAIRIFQVYHRNHTDAAIERAQHFGLRDAADGGEPAEYRQHRNACEIDLRAK